MEDYGHNLSSKTANVLAELDIDGFEATLRFMLRHPRKMGDSLTFCSEDEGVGSRADPDFA